VIRLLLALLASLVGVEGTGTPAQAAPKRVYVVSEARGYVHRSIPAAVAYFVALGRRSPRYDVVHLRAGARALTAQRLRGADAVVFANTTGELPLPDRGALLRFVRDGGGFLGAHSASDTFHRWPAYASLLGGEFDRHGIPEPGRLVVEDTGHPATARLPGSFSLREEFYEFVASPRGRARILVSLDAGSVRTERRSDLPMVWSRREGRGRVFYTALGHFSATWREPRHRRIVAGGLEWVLGLRS
jgi:uncharacterized protein